MKVTIIIISGDLFLALENLKTEEEMLEGTKESQQQRDIPAIQKYLAVCPQQRLRGFQFLRGLEEEEYERNKIKQLESIDCKYKLTNNT